MLYASPKFCDGLVPFSMLLALPTCSAPPAFHVEPDVSVKLLSINMWMGGAIHRLGVKVMQEGLNLLFT